MCGLGQRWACIKYPHLDTERMQLQSKQGRGDRADRQPPEVTQECTPCCLLRKASLSPCILPACLEWDAKQMLETKLYGLDGILLFLGIGLLCLERPWMCWTIVCISSPAKSEIFVQLAWSSPFPYMQARGWRGFLNAGAPFHHKNSQLNHSWETGYRYSSSLSVLRKKWGAKVERRPLTITYPFITSCCLPVFVLIPCSHLDYSLTSVTWIFRPYFEHS